MCGRFLFNIASNQSSSAEITKHLTELIEFVLVDHYAPSIVGFLWTGPWPHSVGRTCFMYVAKSQ
jgi:hypothetical protein